MGHSADKNDLASLKRTISSLNGGNNPPVLMQSIKAGLRGILQGIRERSLPLSYCEQLYPDLAEEIRVEYEKHFPQMDIQLFISECYEYGIKMVYYHEWKEYEKQICY